MKAIKLTKEMSLIQDIDTPAIIVDLNIVKENRFKSYSLQHQKIKKDEMQCFTRSRSR